MTPSTKKIVINLAKRLRNSRDYEHNISHNYYIKFYGTLSTAISKTIKNSFDDKTIFIINLLSFRLNSYEPPEETLNFILKNLRIFVVVKFSEKNSTIGCSCEDGYHECGLCDGAGTIECDSCNGTGDQADEETEEIIDCELCLGSGEIGCGNCNGDSYILCDECYGAGYLSTNDFTEIDVIGYYSMKEELNDRLTYQFIEYNNEGDYEDFLIEMDKLIFNKNVNVGQMRMNVEDFTLSYYDYDGAINFDIDEKYYANSYVIGVYDLFDPNILLTLNHTTFYLRTKPSITSILKSNFCKE